MLKVAALAIAAILGLSGCAAGTAAEETSSASSAAPIRLAYTMGAGTLHVHLAEKLGYFEAHGIEVEATQGFDLPTWVASLDKQYDVAMTSAGIFTSGADKFNLAAIAGTQSNSEGDPNSILIAGEEIKDITDLAGKRVGVLTVTGTTPLSIQYLMREAGGDPASITFVQAALGTQRDQLAAGQLDAVISANPYYTQLLEDTGNHVLYEDVQYEAMRAVDPEQATSANVFFVSSIPWAEANAEKVSGFRSALQEAIDYIEQNPDEAKAELATWLEIDQSIIDAAPLTKSATSTIEAAQIQPLLDLSLEMGTLEESALPDLSVHVTPFE